SPLALSAGQFVVGTILLSIAAPFVARQPLAVTASVVMAVLALGGLSTGAAYVLNYRLITDEGPTRPCTVTYLIPLVALTLGWLVLGEALTWSILLGAAVVLSGVAVSEGRFHVRAGTSEQGNKRPSVTRAGAAPPVRPP